MGVVMEQHPPWRWSLVLRDGTGGHGIITTTTSLVSPTNNFLRPEVLLLLLLLLTMEAELHGTRSLPQSPCPNSVRVALFDEEMAIHESQILRALPGHFVGQDSDERVWRSRIPDPQMAPKSQLVELPESGVEGLEMCIETYSPKRRRMELSGIDQDGVTWITPLRSLLCKELTASDVGDLGRIVLPKARNILCSINLCE